MPKSGNWALLARYKSVSEPLNGEPMKPEEIVALSKAVSGSDAKKASVKLDAGEYSVDFLVHIQGTLKKGEDFEQRIPGKAKPWMLLTAALSHLNGVTVESLVKEAVDADPELVKSIKKQAEEAAESMKEPTVTQCTGKVTTKVIAEDA